MAIHSIPILPVGSVSGNQFRANRIIEDASQTFGLGTVVAVHNTNGAVMAWAGSTLTGAVGSPIGISYEPASNLGSAGLGAPSPYQPFSGTGTTVTFGSVLHESSAVNIPHGAPINDGRVGVYLAAQDTVFSGEFGNNGNTATPAATDVGIAYGLTIDSDSKFWYVDKNKTGASAAVMVIALDPRDTPASGTRVWFTFLSAVVNIPA